MQARNKSRVTRFRLRHKLTIALSIAALLPVLVVWWVAGRVVLDNLDRGVKDDTQQQLQVGLSLVLRTVQRISADAARVAGSSDLAQALHATDRSDSRTPAPENNDDDESEARPDDENPAGQVADTPRDDRATREARRVRDVRAFLDRTAPYLPSSLIQIFDESGSPVDAMIVGNLEQRFEGMRVASDSQHVEAGLRAEQRMTIDVEAERLVVRAAAPVLDLSFRVRGVVVISVPLDRAFADSVKGALGTDVLIFAGDRDGVGKADSTFLTEAGEPQKISLEPDIARRVLAGERVLAEGEISSRSYVFGYTPLIDRDGEPVGIFAVAVDSGPLATAQQVAARSLVLSAAGAVIIALLFGYFLSRRLTGPLSRLHRGALAVARGDLEHEISAAEGDEIGDLASAFVHMTEALKENRERLSARMEEIMALHDAARAMSSVIDLDEVLRRIVDSVARVLDVRLCALWLAEETDAAADAGPTSGERKSTIMMQLGAARAKPVDTRTTMDGEEGAVVARPLRSFARRVAMSREPLRVDEVSAKASDHRAAIDAGVTGSLLAMPLSSADQVVGVIVVGRTKDVEPFSDADLDLLSTFADQAASAVSNARLYQEVRAFNEELESAVHSRTAELTHANAELEKTLRELRETQAQLISSERMAGLGLLVASVAHEINSPSAAIAGSVDALDGNVARLIECSNELATLTVDPSMRGALSAFVTQVGPALAEERIRAGAVVRRVARSLRQRFEERGFTDTTAKFTASRLAELNADDEVIERFVQLSQAVGNDPDRAARTIVSYLLESVFLCRSALTIRHAIGRIQRIVGALKRYSHLDQDARSVRADVHAGIEDTLVILDYALRDITVVRRYGALPTIPLYVDELNQVWTNLIQNAIQALQGEAGEIIIETRMESIGRSSRDADPGRATRACDGVAVCIIDNGPGIPKDVLPRIFEPFYTTKPKGEGTGLGLGIVRQIVVDKHGGEVTCESRPGRTEFRVWLPNDRATSSAEARNAGLEPYVGPQIVMDMGPEVIPGIGPDIGPDIGPGIGPEVAAKPRPEIAPEAAPDTKSGRPYKSAPEESAT